MGRTRIFETKIKKCTNNISIWIQLNKSNSNGGSGWEKYQYSLEEVDTEFFELKKYKDPDVRYYACVVDKNRAGAKPKVVFRLNLAYNMWEELGYLRLKS